MNTNKKYKVLMIGCGNIAGGYDLVQPDDELPLTHAKAFIKHGSFEITACVDPNYHQLKSFQSRWQVPQGFLNLNYLVQQRYQFDIVSICSPSTSHYLDIQTSLLLQPKIIFCEKPVTLSLVQTLKVVKDCAKQNVLLGVNYSRRWSPNVIKVKQELSQGYWGSLRSVSSIYNKGLLNNGSHMFDLLLNLFGPLRLTHVGQNVNDHFEDDPTIDVCLQTAEGVPIQLNIANAQDYALFEMQIVMEKGVINMEDGGARWRFRKTDPSKKILGYSFLNTGEWQEPKGSYALTGAVANLHNALTNGIALACTGEHALQAQTLCEQIVAQMPEPQSKRTAA